MCLMSSAIVFSNVEWLPLATRCSCTSYVRASSIESCSKWWYSSDTVALLAKAGIFTCGETHDKRPHMHFNCGTCSLPVTTGKFTWTYTASTSRTSHATARVKVRNLWVTAPAGCVLTYFHLVVDYPWCDSTVTCTCVYFCLRLLVFLPAYCMDFCLQSLAILHDSRVQICMSSACKVTSKLPAAVR